MKLSQFLYEESRISDEEVLDILAASFTDDQDVFDDLVVSSDGKFHFDLKNAHTLDFGNRGNIEELMDIHDRFQIDSCASMFIFLPPGATSDRLQWLPRICSSGCQQYEISAHGDDVFDISILPTEFHNDLTSFDLDIGFLDYEDHPIFNTVRTIRLNPLKIKTFRGFPISVNARISFITRDDKPFHISLDGFPSKLNSNFSNLHLCPFIEANDLKELTKHLKFANKLILTLNGDFIKNVSYASKIEGLQRLYIEDGPPQLLNVTKQISDIVCSGNNIVDIQAELEELLIPLGLDHVV